LIPYSGLELCEKLAIFYGATLSPVITPETTHIIVDSSASIHSPAVITRYKAIHQILEQLSDSNSKASRAKSKYIVYKEWVSESVASRDDLDEREFLVDLQQIITGTQDISIHMGSM